jgi:superfamily II DNA or RNA helicase
VADPAGGPASDDLPGLRDLDLRLGYDTADEALLEFYVPALSRAKHYDRSVGYFRASALSVAAKGLSRFIAGGGTARFLIGAEVGEADRAALVGAQEIPPAFAAKLAEGLVPADEIAARRLEVLAWMVKERRLEIKVAIAVDEAGEPVLAGVDVPYFHEKIGVLRDHREDGVVFHGSINESATAWLHNFESFSVFRSWDGTAGHYDLWVGKFQQRWDGKVPGFRVYPLPEAVEDELIRYAPSEPPPDRDVEEPEERADRATLSRFLLAAPHLVGSQALAEATSGVSLFPHQRKVAERLAGEYPRSWLLADEVGLGKTIGAGMALRRLLLSGRIRRALVMAPANVCVQWADEMFEKFGLWLPRLDGNKIHGAHPTDVTPVSAGTNPYDEHPVLLVSSHLARLPRHQNLILAAEPYDLIVVDEAHHARRRAADLDEYRPSRLLQLLDRITDADHAKALWLLTATPMQIHPIELVDLLRQVGLSGAMESFDTFDRYYAELAKDDDTTTHWAFLARTLAETPLPPWNSADRALLSHIETRLGPVQRSRIERFGTPGQNGVQLADELGPDGRRELRAWLRHRSPVGELVTRHSRMTLKRYRARGLLHEPVADRDVKAVTVPFTREETALYEELDGLLDRLMAAHGKRQGAGFVLNVYRRRLTSSWEAIRRTFERRMAKEAMTLEVDLLDEAEEDLETDEGEVIDDTEAVPLTASDLAEIDRYIDRLAKVADSKFDVLEQQINEARGSGRAVIVFTQFTDTLDYLRDRLHPSYRSHLATYSGSGGRQWLEDEGWVGISKQDLVERVRSGVVSVILATDAASEGLNLQSASYLISWDLPYNPMRVEQRIGRIDRIGQQQPTVIVRNFVIPGTVEESVYEALASRIDLFAGLVGQLQPILGATEEAFRQIFRTPRSERAQAQKQVIDGLLAKVDDLERSGIELSDEDPLPDPEHSEPPVTLEELRSCLVEDLDVALDSPGRPASYDPARVSRDPERWTALATYGHPDLEPALTKLAGTASDRSPLVLRDLGHLAVAFRADRTPPDRVRRIDELFDLGDAVAAGDAERLALAELEAAADELLRAEQELAGARRERWERGIRRRFRQLVVRAINAEAVIRMRRDGEPPEPQLVWMDLTQDTQHGWENADPFRQWLDLELTDVLPRGGPGADDRGDRELARVRADGGRELVELIQEWMAVAMPDAASSRE